MANVDYTRALQNYRNSQAIQQRSLRRYGRAGPGTALATALTGYITGQGMDQAQHRMGVADKAENDQRNVAMSEALGAYREDTPFEYDRMEDEAPIEGLRNIGTGHNVNALAQSMMGSGVDGMDTAGLGILAQQPGKRSALADQLHQMGLTPGTTEWQSMAKQLATMSKAPVVNTTVNTGGELPKGWQYIDPTNPRLGAQPIPEGPADPDYLAKKKKEELEAAQAVKDEAKNAANAQAYATYEVTRDNVMRSIQKTSTGYFAGRVPAIEASAQVAEHANNVLFPAIKKLVRDGESGVFTDQDAMDVRKLLPTRETHPDALPMVMWQLNSWVASKMGQAQPPLPEEGKAIENPTAEQYQSLKVGDRYLWDGVPHVKGQ